jgi:sugar-specific transcriptional regulator TrmB
MNVLDLKKQLIALGLSPNEADVYLALLGLGESSVGEIIKKTRLHQNVVYKTLEKLKQSQLVSESNKRGVKFFKSLGPDKILSAKKAQLDLASNLIPQLNKIKKKGKVEVTIYEGVEGFQTALLYGVEHIKSGHEHLLISAGGKAFYNVMGETVNKYDKLRMKKSITSKMIAYESQRKELARPETKNRPLNKIKYLKTDFSTPSATSIFDDLVLLQVYSDPPLVIAIRNKEVARSYKDYFNFLWNLAKK